MNGDNPLAAGTVSPEFIQQFFVQKGVPPAVAQGWAQRLMVESGGNPLAVNPTSGALGLAQDLGSRKSNLLSLPNWQDPTVQLNNIWNEMHGGDPTATQHFGQMESGGAAGAYQGFTHWFERPGAQGGDTLAGTTHPGSQAEPTGPLEGSILQPVQVPPSIEARQTMLGQPSPSGDPKPNPLMALQLLSMLVGQTHKITPVDYDPWKYVPGGGNA